MSCLNTYRLFEQTKTKHEFWVLQETLFLLLFIIIEKNESENKNVFRDSVWCLVF